MSIYCEAKVQTYFFDIAIHDRAGCDYGRHDFATPEKAYELAELTALDLAVASEDHWGGSAVNVRSVEGQKILCIPVEPAWLAVS
jgi:hypothetical protein